MQLRTFVSGIYFVEQKKNMLCCFYLVVLFNGVKLQTAYKYIMNHRHRSGVCNNLYLNYQSPSIKLSNQERCGRWVMTAAFQLTSQGSTLIRYIMNLSSTC